MNPRVLAVVGPTGTGKSDLGVALAQRLGGEIVNADSMQVYRGMDIGTAKLSPAERAGVPHHLLDIWDISHPASVAEYRDLARVAITAIASRGRVPILVGGSGLYVRAVLDDLDLPGHDPAVRARWEAELASVGPVALHDRLAGLDPAAAAGILPTNGRRIVRALEVVELRGSFTSVLPEQRSFYPHLALGLALPRAELDTALEARVVRMWRAGFVDEVLGLMPGIADAPTASRALGYRQILDHLAGLSTQQEAQESTIRATRKFARRQESWFRRDEGTVWLAASDPALRSCAQASAEAFLAA